MKPRLYLETTIPSYLTAWPSRDLIIAGHQQITKEWWRTKRQSYDIFVSQFVLDEAAAGDPDAARERMEVLRAFPSLDVTEAAYALAETLMEAEIIPEKAMRDAFHIAVSVIHRIDYLMTWNCTHIANAALFRQIHEICAQRGLRCPVICTPEELMGD